MNQARFLILVDDLRGVMVWVWPLTSFFLSFLLISSSRRVKSWKKPVLAALGWGLVIPTIFFSVAFLVGNMTGLDAKRAHIIVTSRTGTRTALLSHNLVNHFSDTKVTFMAGGCCTYYIAYEYQGERDDHMGADAVKWIDDRHLLIRYPIEPEGFQKCEAQLANVQVLCQAKPTTAVNGSAELGSPVE